MLMVQSFSLTWIDIFIALIPFTAIYIRFHFDSLKTRRAFKVLLHPATLLSSFVLIVVYISRF